MANRRIRNGERSCYLCASDPALNHPDPDIQCISE